MRSVGSESLRVTSEQHHGLYEMSAPKHNWWDWYAAYLSARQVGRTPDEAAQDARRYMETIGT